ncbi:MAG: acetyl-CoA carboxylase biotin carboxyl carrier protein subunit, partial [Silvanigrellaceae bacterium]|nr:acetyl-CoA carboxylase biotin carboxyl carrier protein subunit [Silvanigrellaceae bacterium]
DIIKITKNGPFFTARIDLYTRGVKQTNNIFFSCFMGENKQIELFLLGERLVLPSYKTSALLFQPRDDDNQIAELKAPMAGKVLDVSVKVGELVTVSQVLFIVESMKMQLEIKATKSGLIKEIFVNKGQSLQGGDLLAQIE